MRKGLKISEVIGKPNKDIKVGDKVKMIDGSSFTHDEEGECLITKAYPHLTSEKEVIKNLIGTVRKVGVTNRFAMGAVDTLYPQDLVVEFGSDKFRTASSHVEKVDYYEVGKWYKVDYGALICFQGYGKNSYGFGTINMWTTEFNTDTFKTSKVVEASHLEVEKRLIQEAKDRGFKEGCRFILIEGKVGKISNDTEDYSCMYLDTDNGLWIDFESATYTIFRNGKWAEMLGKGLPMINGYDGKLSDDGKTLQYGCAELNTSWFLDSSNRSVKTIVLDTEITIREEEIEQIKQYLKENGF